MSVTKPTTLSSAPKGVAMSISSIEGNDEYTCQLYAIGFCEGAQVVLEKPGNPSIISIGASRIAIERALLERVSVSPALMASGSSKGVLQAAMQTAKDVGRSALGLDNACSSVALPSS